MEWKKHCWPERQKVVLLSIFLSAEKREPQRILQERITLFSFCFAPKVAPKISLSVYIENAGFGGTYATPIASLIIEKYLKGEIRGDDRKNLEKRMMDANLLNVKP